MNITSEYKEQFKKEKFKSKDTGGEIPPDDDEQKGKDTGGELPPDDDEG